MSGEEQQVSTFPPPPPFFRLFEEYDDAAGTVIVDGRTYSVDPPPPFEGEYSIFGQTYSTKDEMPSLEDQGVKQLYKDSDSLQDLAGELKKINHSLLITFRDLIDNLSSKPETIQAYLEHVQLLLINFHHIVNLLRPHQAREAVAAVLRDQLAGRKAAVAALRDVISESEADVARASEILRTAVAADTTEYEPQVLETVERARTAKKVSERERGAETENNNAGDCVDRELLASLAALPRE